VASGNRYSFSLLYRRPDVIPKSCTIEVLAWAHDMYVSRRFPDALGTSHPPESSTGSIKNPTPEVAVKGTCSALTQQLGLMMPVMDLLNHSPGVTSSHVNDGTGVAFFLGKGSDGGVKQGSCIRSDCSSTECIFVTPLIATWHPTRR